MNEDPVNIHDLVYPREQRYTANQPLFFPPLYMMDRFARVAHLVFMEEAQFSKFGHQARAQIQTKQGTQHLVLPLKDRTFQRLCDIELHQPERWARKFLGTLQMTYGRYEAYRGLRPDLEGLVQWIVEMDRHESTRMTAADVGIVTTLWCISQTDIELGWHRSRDLVPERPGNASEWVAKLGVVLDCREYLGGGSAMEAYVQPGVFSARSIRLAAQRYTMVRSYEGVGGKVVHDPWISTLDPLMVGGGELVRDLIGLPD